MSRRRAGLGVLLLLLPVPAALALTRSTDGGGPSAPSARASARPVVAVVRQDISEVVSLPGTFAALPRLSVDSPGGGVLTRNPRARSGSRVAAGTPLFAQGGRSVEAPVAGTIVGWLLLSGEAPAKNVPVVVLAYDGFGITAQLAPETAYRILDAPRTARADVVNGPGPFDCRLVSPAPADPEYVPGPGTTDGTEPAVTPSAPDVPAAAPGAGTSSLLCAAPGDVEIFPGVAGNLAVVSGDAPDALVLPTSAVLGTAQAGEVSLVGSDGRTTRRRVTLGFTNGGLVQITSGLSAGQRVLATAPALRGTA